MFYITDEEAVVKLRQEEKELQAREKSENSKFEYSILKFLKFGAEFMEYEISDFHIKKSVIVIKEEDIYSLSFFKTKIEIPIIFEYDSIILFGRKERKPIVEEDMRVTYKDLFLEFSISRREKRKLIELMKVTVGYPTSYSPEFFIKSIDNNIDSNLSDIYLFYKEMVSQFRLRLEEKHQKRESKLMEKKILSDLELLWEN